MTATEPRQTAAPTAEEREELRQFLAHYEAQLPTPRFIGPEGEPIPLPPAIYPLLAEAIRALARGEAVAVMPLSADLTTQEAADYLNVSRQYFVRLLDQGAIPFAKVGTHRRVAFGDLDAYKRVRDQERRALLDEMTRQSDEWGLYDLDLSQDAVDDSR